MSGTDGDRRVVKYINDHWKGVGLDPVKRFPYKVLLSSPDVNRPSRVELCGGGQSGGGGQGDGGGQGGGGEDRVLFSAQLYERILRAEQNQSDVVPPFNVYSKPGVVQVSILVSNN